MRLYTERTRAEDKATQGCDRSADAEAGIEGDRVAPFGAYGDQTQVDYVHNRSCFTSVLGRSMGDVHGQRHCIRRRLWAAGKR